MNEDFLINKLAQRREHQAFRELKIGSAGTDFCSNDYLGIVTNKLLEGRMASDSAQERFHGSTGSRLISGNYVLIEEAEREIADFHEAGSGLIFNSGYEANLGLLSSVPQRQDTVLYDALSHASIRDGIRLGNARSFSFLHNDLDDLEKKLRLATNNVFVVTESVFSMDGDIAPLEQIAGLCSKYKAFLVVDEAHATGVIGEKGEGVVQSLGLADRCFARIYTFGKALGCHGAIVAGSRVLRDYLVNFCRPFIYTTAMPASQVLAIKYAYSLFPTLTAERLHLGNLINVFRKAVSGLQLTESHTPVQSVIIPGNEQVKKMAFYLQEQGMDVRAILYPSVPEGKERLRIVLHAFNTLEETDKLAKCLSEKIIYI